MVCRKPLPRDYFRLANDPGTFAKIERERHIDGLADFWGLGKLNFCGRMQPMAIDMDKLNAFIGRFVGDLGAAVHTGMVVIGEKLGLYKALAAHPMTSAELAAKTANR